MPRGSEGRTACGRRGVRAASAAALRFRSDGRLNPAGTTLNGTLVADGAAGLARYVGSLIRPDPEEVQAESSNLADAEGLLTAKFGQRHYTLRGIDKSPDAFGPLYAPSSAEDSTSTHSTSTTPGAARRWRRTCVDSSRKPPLSSKGTSADSSRSARHASSRRPPRKQHAP